MRRSRPRKSDAVTLQMDSAARRRWQLTKVRARQNTSRARERIRAIGAFRARGQPRVPHKGKASVKALVWHGKSDIRCEAVPDPKIEHGRDAIIKVTACAICGSDLHIFNGVIPTMEKGDVLGHETMGEVVE